MSYYIDDKSRLAALSRTLGLGALEIVVVILEALGVIIILLLIIFFL